MNRYIFLLIILLSNFSQAQVLECERFSIFNLKDTVVNKAPNEKHGVYFKMTTDTNTLNTGYTSLYFVNQASDTLNPTNVPSHWLPSTKKWKDDTLSYTLFYKDGITSFPENFDGYLVTENPECKIPFEYATTSKKPEANNSLSIDIFPNPTQSQIQIKNSSTAPLAYIELYNPLGQRILTKTENLNKIDLTPLQQGSYILRAHLNDDKVIVEKLIKY